MLKISKHLQFNYMLEILSTGKDLMIVVCSLTLEWSAYISIYENGSETKIYGEYKESFFICLIISTAIGIFIAITLIAIILGDRNKIKKGIGIPTGKADQNSTVSERNVHVQLAQSEA